MWLRSHPMASSCLLRNPVTMTGVIHTSTVTYPLKAASIMPGSNRTPPYHHREAFISLSKERFAMGGQAWIRTTHDTQADRRVFASFLDGYPLPSILPILPFLSSRTGRAVIT